jgi:poly-gamma-glutamate synthesis protein (capsule biosynthesis protein)
MKARLVAETRGDEGAQATVVVGGDVCPMNRHVVSLLAGRVEGLWGPLLGHLRQSDLNVVNLECPVVAKATPITKTGPVLSATEAIVPALSAVPIHAVSLANNHVRDHGDPGVDCTVRALSAYGIMHFGAGASLEAASRVRVTNVNGIRLGLLGMADREFNSASSCRAGANGFDEIRAHRIIAASRAEWDVLVVLLHMGHDRYPYPSPGLQTICRWLVELGASAVVCQHSHCAGSVEPYRSGLIVYGQGNLLFDVSRDPGRAWNEGFLLKLRVSRDGVSGHELVPFRRDPGSGDLLALGDQAEEVFLAELNARSEETASADALRRRWKEYCDVVETSYLSKLAEPSLVGRVRAAILRRAGVAWRPVGPAQRRLLGNLIRCRDHREVLETILADEEDVRR